MFSLKGGFDFIATVLDMQLQLPIQITPTLKLEHASDAQIEVIKPCLESRVGTMRISNSQNYECHYNEIKDGAAIKYESTPLTNDKWRYYILSYAGSNYQAHQFFYIANLVAPYIISFASYFTSEEFGKGRVTGSGSDNLGGNVYYLKSVHIAETFNEESLKTIQELLEKYLALDAVEHEGIKRAIELNWNLSRISNLNNLPILGLFMIIEMLLTHNPSNKEIGDSLTHQIKHKIAFLSSRFSKPLDYSVFGNQVKAEKIWSCLYNYRSCIAHGNHIDFTDKELQALKDADTAFNFLTLATRTLLAHALTEPDVINGLKPI